MKLWSAMYPEVLVHVQGCPDPLLDQEILKAAREFFRRTRAWQLWLDPVTTSASSRQYSLTLPTSSDVVSIDGATLNSFPVTLKGYAQTTADPEGSTNSEGQFLTTVDLLSVVLSQSVSTGDSLQVLASLMPSTGALGLDDGLFDRHRSAIAEGAIASLARIPGPFQSSGVSAQARSLFEAAIASAAVDAWRGNTSSTPRARPKWC